MQNWFRQITVFLLIAAFCPIYATEISADQWRQADGPLKTRWTEAVTPENAHREYPRPQMVRKQWESLNGLWDYAIRPKGEGQPKQWDGKILVPFAAESALSGVMKDVGKDNTLWYRRQFTIPENWNDQQVLLHFDAVDWECEVTLNGKALGSHRGGYSRFSFNATDALDEKKKQQELIVSVWDPTDTHWQPRGKQVNNPQGIMYTAVTGIWQSVWIEPVHVAHIQSLKIVPDVDQDRLLVTAMTQLPEKKGGSAAPYRITVTATGNDTTVRATGRPNQQIPITIKDPRLWSPEDPYLYDLRITLESEEGSRPIEDEVKSYFGMRKVELGKDASGTTRIFLNGKPTFMFGPLDQGWWPDGLYTAPTDEALRFDVEMTRKLGYNMCRKHVKVEPDRWYYWCDRLGLLVWQDMPNGDRGIHPGGGEITRTPESADNFRQELEAVVNQFQTHPSIVFWIPFNEGWGQFETKRIVGWLKQHDPTRLVIGSSGWNDIPGVGDAHDLHIYPGPGSPEPDASRAAVLGEYGGLGLPMPGHLWQKDRNWGYRTFKNQQELAEGYVKLIDRLTPFIALPGLSAAVYTQTTDVEGEVNGLMTYDREVVKLGSPEVVAANRSVYQTPPPAKMLAPTSQKHVTFAKYTTDEPKGNWFDPTFDDSSWIESIGGFGSGRAWNVMPRTAWKTDDIWLRRTIVLDTLPEGKVVLFVYHDDAAEAYVNGHQLKSLPGADNHYRILSLSSAAQQSLHVGDNVIAIHCHNHPKTHGFVDVGAGEILADGASSHRPQPRRRLKNKSVLPRR